MEEKFKNFLETAFREIAPTKGAMEYRKQLYKEMRSRAQELKIRGLTDEELLVDTVLDEYADIGDRLKEYEASERKTGAAKRNAFLGVVVAVVGLFLLSVTYVLVGCLTNIWHPTWLIMVGGVFLGIGAILTIFAIKTVKKRKFWLLRLIVAVAEVLFAVFIFLLLQIVFGIAGSWMTFLAMVALLFGVDTAIAFFTYAKGKWVELPVFIEVFSVMLYVMLGILLGSIWHPGWLMCLSGVLAGAIELVVFIVARNAEKNKKEKRAHYEKFIHTDEKYWTDWNE